MIAGLFRRASPPGESDFRALNPVKKIASALLRIINPPEEESHGNPVKGKGRAVEHAGKWQYHHDAANKSLGLTMAALEGEWASRLSGRLGWLIYMGNNLYEMLFVLASLISIVAVVSIIAKRVAQGSSGEEDEG
ncbi:MAG: hypothetical protein ABSD38_08440 [Syntrophorhabdales bacterium]|jgi:hypothetical protein